MLPSSTLRNVVEHSTKLSNTVKREMELSTLAKKIREAFSSELLRHSLEVYSLSVSYDLNTLCVKVIEKTRKSKAGAANVG